VIGSPLFEDNGLANIEERDKIDHYMLMFVGAFYFLFHVFYIIYFMLKYHRYSKVGKSGKDHCNHTKAATSAKDKDPAKVQLLPKKNSFTPPTSLNLSSTNLKRTNSNLSEFNLPTSNAAQNKQKEAINALLSDKNQQENNNNYSNYNRKLGDNSP
jgi:hypothetical protein